MTAESERRSASATHPRFVTPTGPMPSLLGKPEFSYDEETLVLTFSFTGDLETLGYALRDSSILVEAESTGPARTGFCAMLPVLVDPRMFLLRAKNGVVEILLQRTEAQSRSQGFASEQEYDVMQ